MLHRRHCLSLGLSLLPSLALASKPLRVALLPYPGLYDREGSESGFDLDAVRELGQRAACQMAPEPTNAARLWGMLSSGHVQISSGVTYLPERLNEVDYLLLMRVRPVVVMRSAQAELAPTRAAFDANPALRLGVTRLAKRPASTQAWVDQLQTQGRISEAIDTPLLMRLLDAGRVDAMLAFPVALSARSERWRAEHRVLDWVPGDAFTFGIAVSKRGVPEALRERLVAAADAAHRDGSVQRLAQRHFGDALLRWIEFLPVPR